MIICEFGSESESNVGLDSVNERKLKLIINKLISKFDELDFILFLHEELIKISKMFRFKLAYYTVVIIQ